MLPPAIYRINTIGAWKIALAPRPRGGDDLDDEMVAWRNASIDLVVSLLETAEARELELVEQASSCQRNSIAFRMFSIPDRGVPERRDKFIALIAFLTEEVKAGKSLLIHCRAGIGRTGLVACCLLQSLGIKAEQAWALLSEARGVMVPDTEQQKKYAELFLS
jgi:protein-tyrosine phosphatase